MQIRLLTNLPLDEKFKLTKGKVVEVAESTPGQGRGTARWWVMAGGNKVGVLSHEAEIVDETIKH